MRVMVLGGTGLLGHETVRVLLERGHEVTLLARHSPPQSLTALRDLPVVIADAVTTQPDEFAHLLSGFDAAVYAMGPDDRTTHEGEADAFFETHLFGATERLVEGARLAGVGQVVLMGSYFTTWARMRPDLDLAAHHPYVRARLAQSARAFAAGGGRAAGGTDVMVLEIPYVFGSIPGQVPHWKRLLFDVVRKGPVALFLDGGTSVVSSRQVGEAAVGALEHGSHGGQYPLADVDWTYHELATRIRSALGKSRLVVDVPGWLVAPGVKLLGRRWGMTGQSAGLDPSHIVPDILSQQIYVDGAGSRAVLGWTPGGVPEALIDTLRASYPEATIR